MRVLIIFDGDKWHPREAVDARVLRSSRRYTEADVLDALKMLGHHATTCCVQDEIEPVIQRLKAYKPHIVFNCLETIGGTRLGEPALVAMLDLLGVRYTGAGFSALLTCKHKHLVHSLLQQHGIDTPRFLFAPRVAPVPDLAPLSFPVVVKPASLDGSDHISSAAYARTIDDATTRVRFLQQNKHCDVVVEEFVGGRELYIGVLGNRTLTTLAPRELTFARGDSQVPRFATYNAKWSTPHRRRWKARWGNAPRLSRATVAFIDKTATRAYRLLGIEGFARFDVKLTRDQRLFVLDANPNPPISRHDEFVLAAKKSGIGYEQLVAKLLALALARR